MYDTTDFGFAVALVTMGHKLIDVIPTLWPPKKGFQFEAIDDANELEKAYYADELVVSPHAYYVNMREIKTRLINSK